MDGASWVSLCVTLVSAELAMKDDGLRETPISFARANRCLSLEASMVDSINICRKVYVCAYIEWHR